MFSQSRTVLDLFAGAGGMALGFEAAGARCVGAVEIDEAAATTFRNMFAEPGLQVFSGRSNGDMSRLSLERLAESLPQDPEIIVGGPPCQGFSRIGRAKQLSLVDVEQRIRHGGRDRDRNELYTYFLNAVRFFNPKAFVMENVPGMREMLGVDIARRIAREASALRYNIRVFLLNSAWFGVPQQRWRLFFVGLRQDLGPYAVPRSPIRTHAFGPDLPEGMTIPDGDDLIVWGAALPSVGTPAIAVTVREALADLPRLSGHLLGRKPVEEPLPLGGEPSAWARELRNWPGRPAPELVTGNWYRYTPRDFRLFREMASGDRYPQAVAIAHRLFLAHLDEQRARGNPLRPGSTAYEIARHEYIPPYRNDAFDDKWAKLRPGEPAWTITAHLSRDTYSHIHYSTAQARTITVREAARLQSFPDSFEFWGNQGERFSQIGNAVPPLLARAIAQQLLEQLTELEMSDARRTRTDRARQRPNHNYAEERSS